MQIWWRDHQKVDAERKKRDYEDRKQKHLKKQALSKLTTSERKALGL